MKRLPAQASFRNAGPGESAPLNLCAALREREHRRGRANLTAPVAGAVAAQANVAAPVDAAVAANVASPDAVAQAVAVQNVDITQDIDAMASATADQDAEIEQ